MSGALNYDKLLQVIGQIYDTSHAHTGWEPVLNSIADTLGMEMASVAMVLPRLGVMTIVAPRTDPGMIPDFQDHWHTQDLSMTATMGSPVDQIVTLKETGREDFLKSPFYNEYWKKTGHAAERLRVNLIKSPQVQINFGMSPFARDDTLPTEVLEAFSILQPHLKRAFEIEETLKRAELARAQTISRPQSGAVLVTHDARIILADVVAETHLERGVPLGVRSGLLTAFSSRDTSIIRHLIAGCTGQRDNPAGGRYQIGGGEIPTLELDIVPIFGHANDFIQSMGAAAPAALVIIGDPERRAMEAIKLVQKHFELTEAEARVAIEMLNGGGRDAVAVRLGLSPNTVRTHLSNIFEKTGTSRQAELIRTLMSFNLGV